MKLGLAFASLFVATSAYAQAPGDYSGDGDYAAGYEAAAAPGMVAPVVIAPTPPPPPKPRRWSVGLGFGSLSLAPHSAPESETEFGIGQLAVRFLATRHLEIELAFAGGREQLDDGEGDREVSQGVLALRYRFSPQRRWNWWLMAGMGSLAVTRHEASEDEHHAAEQSTLQFGVGLERRWSRFALQLELRAVGVKANDETATMPVRGDITDGMTPPPDYPDYVAPSGSTGMAGGQMVFTGNYYF